MCEAASPFEKTRSKVTVFGDLAYDAQTSAGYELANSTSGQSDCTLSPSVTGWPSENVQDQLVELFEFTPFGCIEIERRQRSRDQDSLFGNLDLSEHHPKRSMPRVTFNSITSFNSRERFAYLGDESLWMSLPFESRRKYPRVCDSCASGSCPQRIGGTEL